MSRKKVLVLGGNFGGLTAAHLMKLAFEKYFLWKARHGYVNLP